MSGNAALSAARRRRASTGPSGFGGPGGNVGGGAGTPQSYSNIPNPYNSQQVRGGGGGGGGGNMPPPQNNSPHSMTLQQNVELIKGQMEQRLHVINTQGKTMPPEKLKQLKRQQEIQTQILRQKMILMEQIGPDADYTHTSNQQPLNQMTSSSSTHMKHQPQQSQHHVQHAQQANQTMPTAALSPFVSMFGPGGVVPPPVVVLKSHDEKIGEHDAVLNDLSNRLNYIHSRVDQLELSRAFNEDSTRSNSAITQMNTDRNAHNADINANIVDDDDDDDHNEGDQGEEQVVMMDDVISDLLESREFVQGVVDKIIHETNLSEVILKIDPIIKENQELRSLIHSQQEMMNQMNIMLLRLLNSSGVVSGTSGESFHIHHNTHDNSEMNTADVDVDAEVSTKSDSDIVSAEIIDVIDMTADETTQYDENGLLYEDLHINSEDAVNVDNDDNYQPQQQSMEAHEVIDLTFTTNDIVEDSDELPHFPETQTHAHAPSHISLLVSEIVSA